MVLFLGVASSEDASTNLNLNLPKTTENEMSTVPIVPVPSVYDPGNVNTARPNLLIGGIDQSPNPNENTGYEDFAKQNQAYYVPTYYAGAIKWVSDAIEVNNAAYGTATVQNGLKSPALNYKALNYKQYGTIIGYSGGTATAIAALKNQKVKCDTLILISPMKGTLPDTDYKNNIMNILTSGAVNHIIVIWSPQDTPTEPFNSYEAQISSSWDKENRITVHEEPLPQDMNNGIGINNGMQAHKDIFFDYARENIRNGVYVDPQGQSIANPQPTFQKSPQDQITSAIANENSNLKKVSPKTVLTTPTQITKSEESPQDQITSAIANENSNLGLGLSKLKKIPPKTVLKTPTQITKLAVTLTLYVRDGSASGPIIPGAQVTGQDSSGNSFQQTTDSNGYVTITGDPGTWSFSASADGYATNPWDQEITETCTKHAFLQKAEAQDVEETSSTSAKSDYPHLKELLAATRIRLANAQSNPESVNQPSSQVTLTLYVRDGSASGPIIPGAQVTGQDGSGNGFQQTTDSNGYVTITGDPGTWSFSASANGYATKPWDQEITETCTKHAFLQMAEAQDDEKASSTGVKSDSLKERLASIEMRLANAQSNPESVNQPSSQVTLTLYVRDGSASGPIIPGAQVTGQDSSGNSFQQTTDSNGYVTITGDPGTWSFSASADRYETNNWDQEITEDCTKHAFLQEEQQQENVAPIVQDSESSVVGDWTFEGTMLITFNNDGTLRTSEGGLGSWEQNGNIIRWRIGSNSDVPIYEGTVNTNEMNGVKISGGSIQNKWSADRGRAWYFN
jgi:uncharacterized GH25 family protein